MRFVDHGIVDDIHYRYLRDLPTGSSFRDLPYQVITLTRLAYAPEYLLVRYNRTVVDLYDNLYKSVTTLTILANGLVGIDCK